MPVAITVIVPVHNSASFLRACLEHLNRSSFRDFECIVVDDGSTDDSAEVARRAGVTVLATKARRGPAYARNVGAKSTKGEILFFIDADVCVSPDTLERVYANFEQDPELSAVIGSYDELPESQDFVSLYKNLMHSYVHHNGKRARSGAAAERSGNPFSRNSVDSTNLTTVLQLKTSSWAIA